MLLLCYVQLHCLLTDNWATYLFPFIWRTSGKNWVDKINCNESLEDTRYSSHWLQDYLSYVVAICTLNTEAAPSTALWVYASTNQWGCEESYSNTCMHESKWIVRWLQPWPLTFCHQKLISSSLSVRWHLSKCSSYIVFTSMGHKNWLNVKLMWPWHLTFDLWSPKISSLLRSPSLQLCQIRRDSLKVLLMSIKFKFI